MKNVTAALSVICGVTAALSAATALGDSQASPSREEIIASMAIAADKTHDMSEREAALRKLASAGRAALALFDEQIAEGVSGATASRNEVIAVATLRRLVEAQASYSSRNGGFFGSLECVAEPSSCLPPGSDGTPIYPQVRSLPGKESGYLFTFVPGASPSEASIGNAGASTVSSLLGYTVYATAVKPGTTGLRSFCASNATPLAAYLPSSQVIVNGQCGAGGETIK